MMKHLYFVRHGQSQANLDEIFAGQSETPLTDYGREQAKLAGEETALYGIDLIVSSPLSRALETAEIIATEIGYPKEAIVLNDLLKERFLGSLQGETWHDHPEDISKHGDAESLERLGGRAQQLLNFIQEQEAPNILVVGHGSFAKALCEIVDYQTGGNELKNAKVVQLI